MLVALLPAFQGARADGNVARAKAIWCSGNTTLYFDYCATVGSTYDGKTVTAVYDVPTAYYTGSYPGWSAVSGTAKTVVFKSAFSSFKPLSCWGWFYEFTKLASIVNLDNLDTSAVTNMDFMFDGCSKLETLDVSTFDVSNVETAESMFLNCSELKTIYCNKAWNIKNTASMFSGATQLRGYNSSSTDPNTFNGTMASPAGYFTATQTLTLNYNTSNETTISDWVTNHKDEYANVTLNGDTLYKDTYWNTLCLPFSMNKKQIAESPLAGATIMELDATGTYQDNENNENNYHQTGFDSKTGTLYLYFKEASSIEAGKPYIVKWGNAEKIVSPVFNNVSIDNTASTTVTASNSDLNPVQFIGNYSPVTLTGGDASNLYLGAENKLYYPAEGVTINAFHGYFHVDLGTKAPVRAFVLNFDDEENTTGIISTTNVPMEASGKAEFTNSAGNGWYTLDGRQLGGMPNKGIYIYKGRKVIR